MADLRHVDGNALGGLLEDVFGRDMTAVQGTCRECLTVNVVAALVAYRSGPGDVLRCPACGAVLLVITPGPDGARVHITSLQWHGSSS
jgi:hypothetical protein